MNPELGCGSPDRRHAALPAGGGRLAAIACSAALCAGGAFAVQAAQPREWVVTARHDLPAGHRITAADLTVRDVPAGGSHRLRLLPASLLGLIPGQYLTRALLAGAPVLDGEIHPARARVTHQAMPGPPCGPRR